jgi:hypothetical protein
MQIEVARGQLALYGVAALARIESVPAARRHATAVFDRDRDIEHVAHDVAEFEIGAHG